MADYYFAASTGGFYNSDFNSDIPNDAIALDRDLYQALALTPRPEGAVIVINAATSLPVLSVPPSPYHRWNGNGWVQDDGLAGQQLAARRAELPATITADRDRREAAGFPYQGKVMDSTPLSVQRITAAALAAQVALAAGQPFSLDWTCADNSTLTLDAAGIIGMPVALAKHAAALHAHARNLKAAVAAAVDQAELDAIDIQSGWPGSMEA